LLFLAGAAMAQAPPAPLMLTESAILLMAENRYRRRL
jgi:hypothetical protein